MRITIIGQSGAGKSTLARQLAAQFALTHVELDAINWQPGWVDLHSVDLDEFLRRVEAAIATNNWVVDGNYGPAQDLLWEKATDVVWLDYGLSTILPRVISRSFVRAMEGKELWAGTGNTESFARWFSLDHPILFTLRTFRRNRGRREARVADPRWAGLRIHRLRHPREVASLMAQLESSRPV
jgi:hypothetical protein